MPSEVAGSRDELHGRGWGGWAVRLIWAGGKDGVTEKVTAESAQTSRAHWDQSGFQLGQQMKGSRVKRTPGESAGG